MPSLFSAKFVMVGLRSPAASLYSGSLVSEARRRTHPPGTLCGPICTSAEIKRRKLAGRLSTDCDAMAWHCLDCCQFPFRMHVWTGVVTPDQSGSRRLAVAPFAPWRATMRWVLHPETNGVKASPHRLKWMLSRGALAAPSDPWNFDASDVA